MILTEHLLFCDGGRECPKDSPFNADTDKTDAPTLLRARAANEGWVKRGANDYCAVCAARLGYAQESAT